MTHFIRLGRVNGASCSFSSNSSIKLIFHLSRCICQVPSANVKKGMIPSSIIVGVSHDSWRGLYSAGTSIRARRRNLGFGVLWNARHGVHRIFPGFTGRKRSQGSMAITEIPTASTVLVSCSLLWNLFRFSSHLHHLQVLVS